MRNIFVFGSNTQGRHGKGAALEARLKHGAIYGQSRGLQGNSYAIITKDLRHNEWPLVYIEQQVRDFLVFAKEHPDWTFNVTPIGCGLAGFTPYHIAPLFVDAPKNVILPQIFLDVIDKIPEQEPPEPIYE